MNPQEHIAAALDFLQLADEPVAGHRTLLRSELFWCAAAHAVKAIAKQQNWPNQSHDDLSNVIARLSRTHNDPRLTEWFKEAGRLHRNMYEGNMRQQAMTNAQTQTRRLVHHLAALIK